MRLSRVAAVPSEKHKSQTGNMRQSKEALENNLKSILETPRVTMLLV